MTHTSAGDCAERQAKVFRERERRIPTGSKQMELGNTKLLLLGGARHCQRCTPASTLDGCAVHRQNPSMWRGQPLSSGDSWTVARECTPSLAARTSATQGTAFHSAMRSLLKKKNLFTDKARLPCSFTCSRASRTLDELFDKGYSIIV